MNWSSGFTWFSAWQARRAERRASGPDHGDMGTAFGLDASFGPVDPPAAEGVSPSPSPPPWEHRLTRRSSL